MRFNSGASRARKINPVEGASPGIGNVLRRASKSYSRALQDCLANYHIGLAEYLHLRALWTCNGLSQIEIARQIGIEKASSTTVLNSLEAKNFIRRVRNAGDKRKVNVFLTPAGAKLKNILLPAARTVARQAVDGFTEPETRTLIALLQQMTVNLEGTEMEQD